MFTNTPVKLILVCPPPPPFNSHVLITMETHLSGNNFYSPHHKKIKKINVNAKWAVTWCKVSACGFHFLTNSAGRFLEISPSLYSELQFHNQTCQTKPDFAVLVGGWRCHSDIVTQGVSSRSESSVAPQPVSTKYHQGDHKLWKTYSHNTMTVSYFVDLF